jgi:hypothetical protein
MVGFRSETFAAGGRSRTEIHAGVVKRSDWSSGTGRKLYDKISRSFGLEFGSDVRRDPNLADEKRKRSLGQERELTTVDNMVAITS